MQYCMCVCEGDLYHKRSTFSPPCVHWHATVVTLQTAATVQQYRITSLYTNRQRHYSQWYNSTNKSSVLIVKTNHSPTHIKTTTVSHYCVVHVHRLVEITTYLHEHVFLYKLYTESIVDFEENYMPTNEL